MLNELRSSNDKAQGFTQIGSQPVGEVVQLIIPDFFAGPPDAA
jgi:hypothetical protein